MSPRTVFLGRLIGLYSIVVSLAMVTHKQATLEMVMALMHNPPLLFVVGIMAVAVGLALILGHNVWSGGALPLAITLVGWGTMIKGVLLLFLSPEGAAALFLGGLDYGQFFYLYCALYFLLGIYLTWLGQRALLRAGTQRLS